MSDRPRGSLFILHRARRRARSHGGQGDDGVCEKVLHARPRGITVDLSPSRADAGHAARVTKARERAQVFGPLPVVGETSAEFVSRGGTRRRLSHRHGHRHQRGSAIFVHAGAEARERESRAQG